ncbi:MAG: DUF2189 domain-containing protein [Gammaproteobacteria bacterium]
MEEVTDAEPQPTALPAVATLGNDAPLRWLGRGFDDMLAAPLASLFYGALLALMGWGLVTWYGGAVGLALTTGFLLIGPFLAVGLYDISRRVSDGAPVELGATMVAWRANLPAIGFYALILMLSLAVWMRISVVLVALLVPAGTRSAADLLALLAASPEAWFLLALYVVIGAILASFSYAISAVALPLLLDRKRMDAISAMIVSFQCIRRNPRPMFLWAVAIVILTVAGFLSWFVGLAFTIPLIGHASWHAYLDAVGAEADDAVSAAE